MASSATADRSTAAGKAQVPGPRDEQAASSAETASGIAAPAAQAPRIRMPAGTAGSLLWWGGLAGLAVFGVVDWPVAVIVAAGTWVAEQHARQAGQPARR